MRLYIARKISKIKERLLIAGPILWNIRRVRWDMGYLNLKEALISRAITLSVLYSVEN